ncbi:hypothetical protein HMPREF0044_0516 [Gleimia coleocanis DSM 15436]|uniref:Uncharacterized protein n=1 Tax=Gleimia coleocanis DSM 15436 TaxID=525245 RepID=C0VZC6_9ACTO|nr:hypothetical protein [Gleimia coleocanis]EEH64227.1 hypothetical protein HMPREF0044_0516 [Gleimia coleocanis DSM 15436]
MSDIDEEFQRIISGFSAEDLPTEDLSEAPFEAESKLEVDPLDLPEDESLHLENGSQTVGFVIAPFTSAVQIANILGVYGIERWVVQLEDQIALWCELETEDTTDVERLLGDERPLPEECDAFARILSRLSPIGVIAVVSTLREEDGEVSGDVRARRYLAGEPESVIPGGLLLNGMENKVEDLLLGRSHPQDFGDSVWAKAGH